MKYIVERISNNERTFYGPFLIRAHAQHVIDIRMESDTSAAQYVIHPLLPQAQLDKPI